MNFCINNYSGYLYFCINNYYFEILENNVQQKCTTKMYNKTIH